MAVCKCVSLLVFGVLVAATSLRCASAFTYSDVAGFHGHKFSVESAKPYMPTKEYFAKVNAAHQGGVRSLDAYGPPQANPPIHVNPPAQFSAKVDDVDHPPPAAWGLNESHACMAHYQCSEPTPVCLNGRCVDPPQAFRANNDFNRGGAVLPTHADRGNKGFNRGGAVLPTNVNRVNMGGAVLPTNVNRVNMGFNRGGAVLP